MPVEALAQSGPSATKPGGLRSAGHEVRQGLPGRSRSGGRSWCCSGPSDRVLLQVRSRLRFVSLVKTGFSLRPRASASLAAFTGSLGLAGATTHHHRPSEPPVPAFQSCQEKLEWRSLVGAERQLLDMIGSVASCAAFASTERPRVTSRRTMGGDQHWPEASPTPPGIARQALDANAKETRSSGRPPHRPRRAVPVRNVQRMLNHLDAPGTGHADAEIRKSSQ
jgi:hypothetical protein